MTHLDERRVATHAGAGLVVRVPGLVAVIATGSPGTSLAVDACRTAAVEGPSPGAALDLRLRAVLAAGVTPLPPLAALAESDGGQLCLLVHGSATATAVSCGEEVAVAGRAAALDAVTLEPTVAEVRMSVAGAPTPADGETELANGVVPGAAAVVGRARATLGLADPRTGRTTREPAAPVAGTRTGDPSRVAATATAEPVDDGRRAAAPAADTGAVVRPSSSPDRPPFVSVLLSGGSDTGLEDARPPLPLAGRGPGDAAAEAVEVELVRCPAGHPNDPSSSTCRACDRPLGPDAAVERGPRPALGLLVFDDGATFVLDTDYVVGRAPAGDPQVLAGRARPLVVDDAGRTVSRVHAEVRADGWEVRLSDRGSTNGTFVWDHAARAWVRLVPSEPRRLLPGDRAAVGHRTFRLETRLAEHA